MNKQRRPSNLSRPLAFRISPRLIDLFGKELVTRNEIALAELIKNSYDSDATRVVMEFKNVRHKGGTLKMVDNGEGMTLSDLESKWMLIGTRDKLEHPITGKKRRKVGEKGIGRLGVHKLANRTTVRTKKRGDNEWVVLNIDWARYHTDSRSFEQVEHPCWTEPGQAGEHGMVIELLDLRDAFTEEAFKRLQAELALLIPPLPEIKDFKIEIKSDEFPRFRGEIQASLLESATYKLHATFDGERLRGTLKVRGDSEPIEVNIPIEARHCGPLRIDLYAYIFKSVAFRRTPLQLVKVQKMMDIYRGVRLYRDAFKVGNYGEQGNDWLGIDVEHMKRHEVVLHAREVLGAVHITRDGNPNLVDLTNREGLVQNEAVFDLVTVGKQAIGAINEQRWKERRERQQLKKQTSKLDRILTKIEKTTESSSSISSTARREIHKFVRAAKSQSRVLEARLEKELQMYRNLASLGISTAAFAHETEAIGLDLDIYVRELRDQIEKLPAELAKPLLLSFAKVESAVQRSVHLVDLLLEYVRQQKQKEGKVSIEFLIRSVLERYRPFLNKLKIDHEVLAKPGTPTFRAVPMDWEAVCMNLITNAVWAMKSSAKRKILFEIAHSKDEISLLVSDTGVGIQKENAERIFLPFFTTKGDKGIGLGLTIVQDTVDKYGGVIKPIIPGKLGGATFEINIPIRPVAK